jgi:hypothetical protein
MNEDTRQLVIDELIELGRRMRALDTGDGTCLVAAVEAQSVKVGVLAMVLYDGTKE